MTDTIEREMRCCCDAGFLLGMVPTPPGLRHKDKVAFITTDGERLEFEIATCYLRTGEHTFSYELAVKNHDLPLETLRKIPGFKEINEYRLRTECSASVHRSSVEDARMGD